MMEHGIDYQQINRQAWNVRTSVHLDSAFYDVQGFIQGKNSLQAIELALLGEVKQLKILHLQCHFGQDSLSLARMGAEVTAVDLSDVAIDEAQKLAKKMNLHVRFICSDIYDLPAHVNETFDIVFASYGTIGWLPDLQGWGQIIARYLRPGGKFIFAEFHPFVWMYADDFKSIAYDYFNTGPIVEQQQGTYAQKDAPIAFQHVMWNHSLADIFGGLLKNKLKIIDFQEYPYSPYDCFDAMKPINENAYVLSAFQHQLPLVFSLVAEKEP